MGGAISDLLFVIGLFLFCIKFGWGWTKLIIDLCQIVLVWGGILVGCMNLLVGLKYGCILNLVEFGCVGAEKKCDTVCGFVVLWFVVCGCA